MLRDLTFLTVAIVVAAAIPALTKPAPARSVRSVAIEPIVEKADLSPEQLRATATHIVTGRVVAVYERTESAEGWKTARYVAELRVAQCEKGDLLEDGLVYVRYWHRRWIWPGEMPTSTTGHRGLPEEGDSVRAYLARDAYDGFSKSEDGGFNVIGANGFEPWAPAAAK